MSGEIKGNYTIASALVAEYQILHTLTQCLQHKKYKVVCSGYEGHIYKDVESTESGGFRWEHW